MSQVSIRELLEAGVHFGHQTRRWNPKMSRFIFTQRNGIYIIDLQKTQKQLEIAYDAMREVVANGGSVLFVGTKKQAQDAVEQEALKTGQFYVSHRWLGGMLTNFTTIRKSIEVLFDLERQENDGTFEALPKKEVMQLRKKKEKLEKFMGGIKNMNKLPDIMFVIDPKKEEIAIKEARNLGIPVIGMVDTNCDPDMVDIAIPANDDAIRAIKLIIQNMTSAILEGKQGEQHFDDQAEETVEVQEQVEE